MEVDRVHEVFAFEDVHSPGFFGRWLPCFRWLVIFQYGGCAGDGICFLGKQTGGLEVRLLLVRSWAITSGHGVGTIEGIVLRWQRRARTLVWRGCFQIARLVVLGASPPFRRWERDLL